MADEAELRIDKVVAGGDGLAREADGRVVFVPGALPGERVVARIVDARRDMARGVLLEVVDASSLRRMAPCPRVAEGCGGCGWQHIDPAGQLELKVAIVLDALARTARLPDAQVAAGALLPSDAFRTSVRLAVAPDGRVGFRAARSHRIVPTDHCLVLHPALDELLHTVRVVTDDRPARRPGGGGRQPRGRARRGGRHEAGAVPELRLRVGVASGERSAWLSLEGPDGPATGPLVDRLVDGLAADVGRGPDATVHEVVAGHRFRVSAAAFFQSSPQGAEALVHAVRRAAGELATSAAHAVDAYAGGGLFAATVFGPDVRVTAVESSPAGCADARVNLPAATVVESPMERWDPEPAELVVADPARSGLDRAGVDALAACRPERLVLVSCDPVALARDSRLLAAAGYVHGGSEVFDLFPHTPHIEVVTRFDRA